MIEIDSIRIKPGTKVSLKTFDPQSRAGMSSKDEGEKIAEKNLKKTEELQSRLWAEKKHGLVLVLQGMDTAGKDGTIRKVLSGLNPTGVVVWSFGKPSQNELDHDYLRRIHKKLPQRGRIGVLNRSHYEDVLAVRVHNLVPESTWSRRYRHINEFERMLTDEGTTIIKCFLHISPEEQLERLRDRIEEPGKNWKLSDADFHERKFWPAYTEAFEAALTRCSTDYAPWHVIPANRKWVRNAVISQILLDALEELDPKYPKGPSDLDELRRLADLD